MHRILSTESVLARLPAPAQSPILHGMTETDYLGNHFLIAMPNLVDENFYQSVTFLCEHNAEGAMGIVINRPHHISVGELLQHVGIDEIPTELFSKPVYQGGPVQVERGFVIHTGADDWESTLRIAPNLAVTTSRDILVAIAEGHGPKQTLVTLGYAGWDAGQLDQEIAQNAWLSAPADHEVLFELPPSIRFDAAARLIGVDMRFMSGDVGHA
jgi:putative transcriptional regulator